mmetsp:Transcript_3595/g.8367  ORF Transcript_3595/g.8367 Transcript_3595/m.8367 type:complete len:232 (+) Transcript_3595:570-1265(+)
MPHRHNAHGHLHQGPEGMEAREVPNQRMHHLAVHRMFFATVEACRLRVGDLLQKGDARQGIEELVQATLAQLCYLGQHEGGHGEVRKRQSRQEPGGLIPNLRLLRKPRLQHGEVQHGAKGDHIPSGVELPLHPDEHRGKNSRRDEVQRIVRHHPLPEEEFRVGHFLLLNASRAQFGGGVGAHVAADYEEAAHQDVLLREELQRREVARAEPGEVRHHDGKDQGETTAIDAI